MGKNKPKSVSKKQQKGKAFVVSTMKKGKTKSVATNLKKLNLKTKANIEKADEKFKDLHEVVVDTSKTKQKNKPVKQPTNKAENTSTSTEVDMDLAAESFAKL